MTDEDPALLISSNCKQVATLVLLEGHEGYVDVAAWSPTDDVIVTGSSDRCHLLIETDVSKKYPRSSLSCSGKRSSGIYMDIKLQIGWPLFPNNED